MIKCVTIVFALLLSLALRADAAPADAPSLTRFETSIQAFETSDQAHPPPHHGTVFVGSSTFARWNALEQTFRDLHAINRGFGGSTLPEVSYYLDRIVIPYDPRRIVIYAGTNDIADGQSGEQVATSFHTLAANLRSRLPRAQIYFISISMAPSRVRWQAQFDTANDLIKQDISHDSHLHFIDVRPVMVDAHGKPRPELFGDDQLHMTPEGYALWVPVLRQALR